MQKDISMTSIAKNLKSTLNLPSTSFPMKANLFQNEPQSIKRWENTHLYENILKKNEGKPPFIFHDGPPYANGSIHVGHLLNKVLKDIVVRSQNLLGYRCPFIPGWDCHGLPIEHKVMTEIISKKQDKLNTLEPDAQRLIIRNECQKYASKFINLQRTQMKSLLTLADYENPYITMDPHYERRVLQVFATLVKEKCVYRKLKPVHWSIENKTALAEAELEYYDKIDTSVFVNFELTLSEQQQNDLGLSTPIHAMIWTTTPWTLPANLAIAIHSNYTYAIVSSDGVFSIVAQDRISHIESLSKKSFTCHSTLKGEQLVGLSYTHPFCDRTGTIVHADYVTLEDGSGLVHIAPGHGIDDYQTGLAHGLDVYCPVLGDGTYDTSVPEWLHGLSIWKANDIIVDHLKQSNHLCHAYTFSHSYPHDWRSKTPVIFRSTEQWFISVDDALDTTSTSLREQALTSLDTINFVPAWGKNRLRGMLEARPDWCISRQRSWGLPIPAFRLPNNEILLTEASVNAVSLVIQKEGSDAWFKRTPAELLALYDPKTDADKPESLDITTLEKMYDIFDVWFESGSSWNAVLNERNLGYPADLYLEGSDQHRGWFHLSLLPALGATQKAPFKSVLTHGFIVDKDGKKMSKSTGNALNVDDLLKEYGAEVTRWWVSSLSFENDIKVDTSFFSIAGDTYRKIRNTLRFLLSNINDLNAAQLPNSYQSFAESLSPNSINAYILAELSLLQQHVKEAYLEFKFKRANHLLYTFCNDTLSSFYCTIVKDRLYCDKKDAPRRIETQITLHIITTTLCHLLSPILPHTTEEAYASLGNDDTTIHLKEMETITLHQNPAWPHILDVRQKALKELEHAKTKGIENALDAGLLLPKEELTPFEADLADIFGVSRVSLHDQDDILVEDLREEPRCERSWKRDRTVKERENGHLLSDRDAEAVGEL